MSEASTYSRSKLSFGRYRIVQSTDEDWFVLDPDGKRLFEDRTFVRPEYAGHSLMSLALVDGSDCKPLYDRHSGVVNELIIGPSTREFVLKLFLPPEIDADLDNFAEELQTTKGGVVLNAIALLKIAMEAKHEGKRVVIVDDRDNSEQDITGF